MESEWEMAMIVSAGNGAAAFKLVWATLVNILGTAATASLMRKAARQGAVAYPELEGLVVKRDALDYSYQVPPIWKTTERPPALVHLVRRELFPLLKSLTGDVVVHRLYRVPELTASGYLPSTEVEHA